MRWRTIAAAALAVTTLSASGCKLVWDADQATAASPAGAFDAKAYVSGIWDAKVLPLLANAPDANTVLDAIAKDPESAGKQFGHRAGDGQPWTYLIQGSGKVLSVDTASRHGLMTVDIGPPASPRQLVLQIGPVVFGTALRDALPVISFGDFVNQIEYAEVSRALNDRAVAMARAGADPASLAGKMILFAGAATQPAGNSPVQVTPVSIALAEGAHS